MDKEREQFNDKPVFSLTEISKSLRSVIARNYPRPYYIKAEIVRLNYYPHSGHCYPELAEKEGNQIKTQMRGIIWAAQFDDINKRFMRITGEPMKDGINILCLATIEYDVKYGLSLHIQDVEPTYTLGDMVRNRLQVIERLKKEEIFLANKKRTLPLVPKRIAVISVETSKGYGDFMISLEKNPYGYHFQCTLFPSILQGDRAITTITERLAEIERRKSEFDCVVIIRGGGGDVGLSCYDDYRIASAVAAFPLPVIAGIGHSTNETVTDMVAYESKITPTDVASFFIARYREFDMTLEEYTARLKSFASVLLKENRTLLAYCEQNYKNLASKILTKEKNNLLQWENKRRYTVSKILSAETVKLNQLGHSLKWNVSKIMSPERGQLDNFKNLCRFFSKQLLDKKRLDLASIESQISLLHPDNILKRGFSITYLNGKAITDSEEAAADTVIETKLFRGIVKSIVK